VYPNEKESSEIPRERERERERKRKGGGERRGESVRESSPG
jgi:hypothetical protein